MYVIKNSDGVFCKSWEFEKMHTPVESWGGQKKPLSIWFFCTRYDAYDMLRMLKIRYADDLNDALVVEVL